MLRPGAGSLPAASASRGGRDVTVKPREPVAVGDRVLAQPTGGVITWDGVRRATVCPLNGLEEPETL